MATNKRLQDLTDYKSVLPYASEIFGVYQPLIGWKSTRKINRIKDAVRNEKNRLLSLLGRNLISTAEIYFTKECAIDAVGLKPAGIDGPRLSSHDSIVLQQIQLGVKGLGKMPADAADWAQVINEEILTKILKTEVLKHYNQLSVENCRRIERVPQEAHESDQEFELRKARLVDDSQRDIRSGIEDEAVIAGVLKLLLGKKRIAELASIFFTNLDTNAEAAFDDVLAKAAMDFDNPYLTFDPKKGVKDVSLSPIGIVHLYRQYFFELDTFLGTPTVHVWLSPGSTVELVEISTRKTITEKTVEQALETIVKSEKSTTDQDEISEAVKQDNKDDLKLGATVTVNQSWCTGNASATASLNMDRTQQVARETAHKKMRQQTEKLSSEIRQNYKSTFRTTSEVTDTSSKRHIFTNTTNKLINYELRRKMRQVGVQVQDIGSYLCWETFVDEPGADLGLANLVHIAQPADLLPVPDMTKVEYPADRVLSFQANAEWTMTDGWIEGKDGFIELTAIEPPSAPEGFEVVKQGGIIPLVQVKVSGEEIWEYSTTFGSWDFGARFLPSGLLSIGVRAKGLAWDDRLNFVLGGALRYRATAAKKAEIDAANSAKLQAGEAATLENDRKTKEVFIKAVKERIEFAAGITRRTFEDLREEERLIVYRHLIASLMTSFQYEHADDRSRHVLAELLNSIFDIDKMLYFVAPEWWKPRKRANQLLNVSDLQSQLNESVVAWSDGRPRLDNYLITEKSAPAPLGSSLGWLLQLDGDNLRNAFLNAPWVKAVIPVRPGKEQAAMAWLKNVAVEDADGLDARYDASADELEQIRKGLNDHGFEVGADVTLRNALDFLCIEVAEKHAESISTKKFPDTEINDDNKVTSTPIEKVFEHGFYPLKGGFRVNPNDPNPDPNNKDRYFQVFDQWIEILPTDQVVPVEVGYDPKTGRQV
jgi:hypothetical protein